MPSDSVNDSDSGNGSSGSAYSKGYEPGREFDVLIDMMNDILEAIRGLPYRIGEFARDDRFHKECPSCGKHVSKIQKGKFCPYCGGQAFSEEEIGRNLKVCLKCEKLHNFYCSYCPECGKEMISLPNSVHVAAMDVIYGEMGDPSALEDGLFLYEMLDNEVVDRIKGLGAG